MKNIELFNWTIKVLVKAFFEGTLVHGLCTKCAIGNLIAAANNYSVHEKAHWVAEDFRKVFPNWQYIHTFLNDERRQHISPASGKGKQQLESTGYSVEETARIELAFEDVNFDDYHEMSPINLYRGNENYNSLEHQFEGLMAVVDTLIDIHGGNEEDGLEAKKLFLPHPEKQFELQNI